MTENYTHNQITKSICVITGLDFVKRAESYNFILKYEWRADARKN